MQTGSLPFAMRSTPDLPPSYASVMTVQETPAPAQTSTIDPLDENKFEDPPPYSIVVASIDMQERNAEVSEEQYVPPATSTKKDDSTVASATADLATMSHMCSQERWFTVVQISPTKGKWNRHWKMPKYTKNVRVNFWISDLSSVKAIVIFKTSPTRRVSARKTTNQNLYNRFIVNERMRIYCEWKDRNTYWKNFNRFS